MRIIDIAGNEISLLTLVAWRDLLRPLKYFETSTSLLESTNCFLELMHEFPTVAYYKRAIYS